MTTLEEQDKRARAQALDPSRSFIVQAPAGSGKTELLIQRTLNLLSHVDKAPEEILAVTFTRKAQAEMRHRIVEALKEAKGSPPEEPHKRQTYELAQRVLKKDAQNGWDLEQHPNRLRIMTIDALAAHLVHRMPILSKFGSEPSILSDPKVIYHKAVDAFLSYLEDNSDAQMAFHTLLDHLDNRVESLKNLLIMLLEKRDQWLEHVYPASVDPDSAFDYLSKCLNHAIEATLQNVVDQTSLQMQGFLHDHAKASCETGQISSTDPLSEYAQTPHFPKTAPDQVPYWRGLRSLMLNQKGEVRKKLTKAQGFLAPSSVKDKAEKHKLAERKKAFESFLQSLSPEFIEALHHVEKLPYEGFSAQDTHVLKSLFTLLPMLVAHLKLAFKEEGAVDFIEMMMGAISALGLPEEPTDLALRLDYQIQHILIDEFQDTSSIQYKLFELITAQWRDGDGKTLFLVGDPMQSIYRFRGAEVGLFLRVCQSGFGHLDLTFLQLRRNFRACPSLTRWINRNFPTIFPKKADVALGGVPFSESLPKAASDTEGQTDLIVFHEKDQENHYLIDRLVEILKTTDHNIAILVRTKSHLLGLITLLRAADLSFRATEIQSLTQLPEVMDLCALLEALLDDANKIAWSAVLRAPWCALSNVDHWHLAQDPQKPIIWHNLWDETVLRRLSEQGGLRVKRLRDTIELYRAQRQRTSLSRWLKGLWIALGGPALYPDQSRVDKFFEALEQTQKGGALEQKALFFEQLNQCYSSSDFQGQDPNIRIELMSIHKAKGLEFDTVFMPSLERIPRKQEQALLLWQERPYEQEVELLMAPVKGAGEGHDKLYHYLQSQIAQKSNFEQDRLLYVGLTRAKKQLILSATLKESEQQEVPFELPPKASFLGRLYPVMGDEMLVKQKNPSKQAKQDQPRVLQAGWSLPEMLYNQIPKESSEVADLNRPEMLTGFESQVGTLVHGILQHMTQSSLTERPAPDLKQYEPAWRSALKGLGVDAHDLESALSMVHKAITTTLSSERGRWILSDNVQAHNEYALITRDRQGLNRVYIDRTFVDQDGRCWIIDYKVVCYETPEPGKYMRQLNHYAKLMLTQIEMPIMLGLYFPMTDTWFEQAYEHAS